MNDLFFAAERQHEEGAGSPYEPVGVRSVRYPTMNFFKLYVGDYLAATGTLTVTEHGAYLLMLSHYYATERPLPEGKELYRLLRVETKQEREAVDVVVARFWERTPDGLINQRADDEIRKADHQRTVNREVGKRGGRPKLTESETESVNRKETESVSERIPNRNPNQTPDTRHQTNTPLSPPPEPPKPRAPRSASETKATRLPDDWQPTEADWQFALTELREPSKAERELLKFRNYWKGRAGEKGRKLDWPATWQNWILKAADDENRHGNSGRSGQGSTRKLSLVEQAAVERAAFAKRVGLLGEDDEPLRPRVDEPSRHGADSGRPTVVEGDFRYVGAGD